MFIYFVGALSVIRSLRSSSESFLSIFGVSDFINYPDERVIAFVGTLSSAVPDADKSNPKPIR